MLNQLEHLRVLKAMQTAALRDLEALRSLANFYTPSAESGLANAMTDAVVTCTDYVSRLGGAIEHLALTLEQLDFERAKAQHRVTRSQEG